MVYHLKYWEYFIEMSGFIPMQMIEVLSNSLKLLKIGVSGSPFALIVSDAHFARTRDGLETIMFLKLQEYIGNKMRNDQLIFDKILENIDKQLEGLKEDWADNHIAR